ncbi:hypothetical protein HJG60_011041 [Phyllostomus discolor]|uniref:Uncharacterized protein n=1 Tax=Phyllostomus discolor TaxID=89673 RepID=A0A834AHY4_9CHIR|nr:hypothetical protein HJG60_011041 [Phyllostomus discolor]
MCLSASTAPPRPLFLAWSSAQPSSLDWSCPPPSVGDVAFTVRSSAGPPSPHGLQAQQALAPGHLSPASPRDTQPVRRAWSWDALSSSPPPGLRMRAALPSAAQDLPSPSGLWLLPLPLRLPPPPMATIPRRAARVGPYSLSSPGPQVRARCQGDTQGEGWQRLSD